MENKLKFIEPLLESAVQYGNVSFELAKLKVISKTVNVSSHVASNGSLVMIGYIFLIFTNFGIALWLGELLGKLYYGFFCVAAFYALIALVFYFYFNSWFKVKIGSWIYAQMMKE